MAGYKIYPSGVLVSGGSPIPPTTFTDTGLAANTTYSYTVTAVDGNGNTSTATTAVNVTTPLELLLKDDFNRPNASTLGSPWGTTPFVDYPYFSVDALKAYCQPNGSNTCRSWSGLSVGSFSATFTVASLTNGGIIFWANGAWQDPSYFRVRMSPGGLYLEHYEGNCCPPAGQFYTIDNDVRTATGTIKVETNSAEGRIKVWVNNDLRVNWVDTQYAHSGPLAIMADPGQRLDDVVIYRLP